jgi:di- and tripeptidase
MSRGSIASDIPDFYDNVRQQSDKEKELYQLLERVTGQSARYLTAKWREPSLSIHSVETSGPGSMYFFYVYG